MRRRGAVIWKVWGAIALGAVLTAPAAPVFGAGFAIFEQSGKSTGMAGAVTASGDDPATIFFNAGGMAFIDKASFAAGGTYITETRAKFVGANPFPGDGVTASEHRLQVFPPHAYAVYPINPDWKIGIGLETPFGLITQWNNPDTFAGRFLSTRAAIKDFDVNPTIAWKVTPELGIGIGGIARVSQVELERDAPAFDPFVLHVVNAAKVKLRSDYKTAYGFDLGIQHHATSWFSWGASYHSAINASYTGSAVLFPRPNGDPFDNVLLASLPFNTNIPVKTSIKYPATASLGLAFKPIPSLTVEGDANWTGWSRFDNVPINFPGGELPSSNVIERWKDVWSFRAGLNWASSQTWQWRLGYVFDQTPQPEQTVNPLLPDANRNGITAGIGWAGDKLTADLGVMYLFFADRTRARTFSDDPLGPFFGTYSTRALLISLTLGFHQ